MQQDGKWAPELLIQWQSMSPDDTSWEPVSKIKESYPHFDLEDKVNFMGGSHDANNEYSNEIRNESLRGHMAKRAEREVTNYQGTGSLRRTTRKCQAPNWMKDFVGFKRGNQPKTDQA